MDDIFEELSQLVLEGKIDPNVASVAYVRARGYVLITRPISARLRSAYYEGVRNGVLGHLKKQSGLPEVFFSPAFKHAAISARLEFETKGIKNGY